MEQLFTTQIRSIKGKRYLKVFLKNQADLKTAQLMISKLSSVDLVNITSLKEEKNLTVYKCFAYSIEKVQRDVDIVLTRFYERRKKQISSLFNLSGIKRLSEPHAEVKRLILLGLDGIKKESEYRHGLDDLRLAIETLLREVMKNDASMENQLNRTVGNYMKTHGVSPEISNIFIKLAEYFCKYQNNHVKHHEDISSADCSIIVDMSLLLLKTFLEIEQKGEEQSSEIGNN